MVAAAAEQRTEPVLPNPQSQVQESVQSCPEHAVAHLELPKKLQMMVLKIMLINHFHLRNKAAKGTQISVGLFAL